MMVIALHDRLSGHASRVRVLDRVLTRLREYDGVVGGVLSKPTSSVAKTFMAAAAS
jgi:hypothetical protein